MRNRNWLRADYFDCLARHQVTNVFNSWGAMPPVSEQMALPGSRTNPDLVAARFLLKPGRQYEEAVKAFEPYDSIKEENPDARVAGRVLIAEGRAAGRSAGHSCSSIIGWRGMRWGRLQPCCRLRTEIYVLGGN